MSLMGTLAKVAIGVAVAKGAGNLLKNRGGKVGDDGLFGGAHSPGAERGGTGLEDIMGDLLGGKSGSGGGLGGVLEDLQRQNPNTRDGGLDDLFGGGGGGAGGQGGDLLGSLIKGLSEGQSSGGGLGGLLGGLAGAVAGGQQRKGDFGNILNDAMQRRGEPPLPPTPEQDAAAGLMIRAMVQAAMSDGKLDDAERDKLLKNLGEVSPEERAFVQQELARPVDPKALARQVPNGLQQQVYVMSLLGIDLDNRNEANYLHGLATELGIDQRMANAIHAKMGVPALYG